MSLVAVRVVGVALLAFLQGTVFARAQEGVANEKLRFVLVLSRHGVRSPTAEVAKLQPFSASPWPTWDVSPGYLTAHGATLMTLFGAYDRSYFAKLGLLAPTGCADASRVFIQADSDERTVATGNALAIGMFPGCTVAMHARPTGTRDPLFHAPANGVGERARALAAAAIAGSIGDAPIELAEAYALPLQSMARVLATCPPNAQCAAVQKPLLTLPASVEPGKGDHLVELRGPLSTASSLAEDFLLEYADGMPVIGWGALNKATIDELMTLHTGSSRLLQRTPYLAELQASGLGSHLLATLQQVVEHRMVSGALGTPGDRMVVLVGHDTNINALAGLLNLHWIIDGRADDTPPGGALVFELWHAVGEAGYTVRTYYTSQTLEQMRSQTKLSAEDPPARAPIFIPGCGSAESGYACPWAAFRSAVTRAIDPRLVEN